MRTAVNAGQITSAPVQTALVFEKLCTGCNRVLPREAFYPRRSRGPTALNSQCKACCSARAAGWAHAHPERIRARAAANVASVRRAAAKWQSKQPPGWRKTYDARRDSAARREREARRRARQRAQFVEVIDVHAVFERDGGICGICGEPVDAANFQIDHVVALANGGDHSYANVQISHPLCNQRKGARR